MRLGIIGAGHIGGNIARQAALAAEIGGDVPVAKATVAELADAVVAAVRAGQPIPPTPAYP